MKDMKLQLTLTKPNGEILEQWDVYEDIDLPDLEELLEWMPLSDAAKARLIECQRIADKYADSEPSDDPLLNL